MDISITIILLTIYTIAGLRFDSLSQVVGGKYHYNDLACLSESLCIFMSAHKTARLRGISDRNQFRRTHKVKPATNKYTSPRPVRVSSYYRVFHPQQESFWESTRCLKSSHLSWSSILVSSVMASKKVDNPEKFEHIKLLDRFLMNTRSNQKESLLIIYADCQSLGNRMPIFFQ
jgi:hypothetical protein